MTITTAPTVTDLAQAFASRYGVSCIDFLWTTDDGFDTFTVYADTPKAGVLTTNVSSFDYNSDEDDASIRALLMSALDDTEMITDYTTEIGGTLFLYDQGEYPQLKGSITEASPISYSF